MGRVVGGDARSSSALEVKGYRPPVTATSEQLLSIGEVSRRTGLSAHTLRFYEKEDLLVEPVRRDGAGRRAFSEREIGWLGVCRALRDTGMPLAEIRRYVLSVREGSHTVDERYAVLQRHETRVRAHLAELRAALSTIEAKVDTYGRRIAEGTADRPWSTGGACAMPERPSGPAEEAHHSRFASRCQPPPG